MTCVTGENADHELEAVTGAWHFNSAIHNPG